MVTVGSVQFASEVAKFKVTKKFSEQKQMHVGMEPSKAIQARWG